MFERKKIYRVATGLFAAAMLPLVPMVAATGGGSPDRTGVSANEIVVGACAPLSGQQKIRGTETIAGGKLYFDHVNESGGVSGRKIKLLTCDDKYTGAGAIECFNTLLKDKCFLGTCFMGTEAASELVPLADANNFPMVGFSTGGQFIVEPVHQFVFQLRPSYSDEAAELVNGVWVKAGARKVVIVYQRDPFGAACRAGIFRAREAKGLPQATAIPYERLSDDTAPILAQVKKAAPEAVIIGGGGDMLVNLTKDLRALKIPVATFSSSSDLLVKKLGKNADGTVITQGLPIVDKALPSVQLYDKLCEKQHLTPSASGFEGFLMARTVVEGLRKTGRELTRPAFVKTMDGMHGVDIGLGTHKLNFTTKNHAGLREDVMGSVIHNGQLEAFSDWKKFLKG